MALGSTVAPSEGDGGFLPNGTTYQDGECSLHDSQIKYMLRGKH